MTATKAYVAAGFSGNGAAQSASRLAKQSVVERRIAELRDAQSNSAASRPIAAESEVSQGWLTREYVLGNMRAILATALEEKKLTAAIQAVRLLGLEVGLFRVRPEMSIEWDGDLSKLSMAQLERVISSMQAMMAKELANGAPAEPGDEALLLPVGAASPPVDVQVVP
jgi:hypothetical protein